METGGAPGETRTPDTLLRRQMLYPAELRALGVILEDFAVWRLLICKLACQTGRVVVAL